MSAFEKWKRRAKRKWPYMNYDHAMLEEAFNAGLACAAEICRDEAASADSPELWQERQCAIKLARAIEAEIAESGRNG